METIPYLICFVGGVVCCVIVNWALLLRERSVDRTGRITAAPTLFGPGRFAGDVAFALEQYERLSSWEVIADQPRTAASRAVWVLATSGDSDLALWLMLGVALKDDDPLGLGCEFVAAARSVEAREGFKKGIAGAIAIDLCDRVANQRQPDRLGASR